MAAEGPGAQAGESRGRSRSGSHVLNRVEESVEEDEVNAVQAVEVDLKLASQADLQAAVERLEEEMAMREESLKDADGARCKQLRKQMKHIKEELLQATVSGAVAMSLEHLELYLAFLERVEVKSLPAELENERKKLHESVVSKITNHELAGEPRSGDRAGKSGYAYFKVSLGRRRQMCSVMCLNFFTGYFIMFTVLATIVYILGSLGILAYALGLYAAWVLYDSSKNKLPHFKRISPWWRKNQLYRLFRDYFPIRIIKANAKTKFDPKRNYLFVYHPHGVQSAGAFSMAHSATGFDHLFPGLQRSVQTLGINFSVPMMREQLLALGMGDASRGCLTRALTHKPGSSAVLVTGGARESLMAHPYHSKVVLKDRAGFVKLALRTGAVLVPVWGFGENNLYENLTINSPNLRKWQRRIQKILTFAPLMVAGRGVFNYSGGLIPHRRPISVVVGDPIGVGSAIKEPSLDQVNEVHGQYKEAVRSLFELYKDVYDPKAMPLEYV